MRLEFGEPSPFLMRYRETVPCSQLAPYVRCYWMLSCPVPGNPQIIIPDGCSEVIFHLGDRFLRYFDDGRAEMQPLAFAVGQMERAIVIQPTGRVEVMGVRFHPAGLSAFTRIPQNELTGRMVTCEELWGPSASRRLLEDPNWIESFLLERLQPRRDLVLERSDRQQRRRFQDLVGLSPKRLQRIQRLQFAMTQVGKRDLAAVALEAGYFDQPHFTREFREFTGQSPSQYLREPHAFSDFFTQNVRNIQETAASDGRHS